MGKIKVGFSGFIMNQCSIECNVTNEALIACHLPDLSCYSAQSQTSYFKMCGL